MKRFLALILLFSLQMYAQKSPSIKVNPPLTPESDMNLDKLVEEVLVSKSCSGISNVDYEPKQSLKTQKTYGYFTYEGSEFPFSEGIVLSTGYARKSEGPNNKGNDSDELKLPGNDDLDAILNDHFGNEDSTEDVTYVKFDFVPATEHISFRYILASEEWESEKYECPSSSYMDGFAFVISGPGITPQMFDHDGNPSTPKKALSNNGRNIATFKDAKTGKYVPVSIGNIYNNKECDPPTSNPDLYVSYHKTQDLKDNAPIQYNARTKVLTAEADVQPGKTYSIMLIIGDRGDDSLNSAIFLEAYSFNLGVSLGKDVSVCENEYVLGTDKPLAGATYTWLFNGTEIPSETGASYTAKTTENGGLGSGVYTCKAFINENCQPEDEVVVEFTSPPVIQDIPDVEICDEDGSVTVNLKDFDKMILNGESSSDYEIKYYKSESDMNNDFFDIDDITTSSFEKTTVYVSVSSSKVKDCSATTKFNIVPVKSLELSNIPDARVCDSDSNPTDGKTTIDFNQQLQVILAGQSDMAVTFHKTENDAAEGLNPLPSNYENTTNPETIYVRAVSQGNESCYGTSSFKVIVEAKPELNSGVNLQKADDDTDGYTQFNLLDAQNKLSDDYMSETFTFYTNKSDAEAEFNVISNPMAYVNPETPISEVWARVESVGGCESVINFTLEVVKEDDNVVPDKILATYETCDDYEDGDGFNGVSSFDFSEAESQIKALFATYPTIEIAYYANKSDASSQQNEITDLSSYRNTDSPNTQKISVRVDDMATKKNLAIGEYIKLVVNKNPPTPEFEGNAIMVCLEDETTNIEPLNLNANYTYEWYDASENLLGDALTTDLLKEEGQYTLKVIDDKGCYSTKEILISLSQESLLTTEDLIIKQSEGANSLTIPTGEKYGIGDYQYSLSPDGPFSSELNYSDILGGGYTLYVMDLKGCALHKVPFQMPDSEFQYMKFFTPNGDGENDYWRLLKGKNSVEGLIDIFDRYGKLMTQIDPKGKGWDGTYQGVTMPSTDYWFHLTLKNGRAKRAHFSLIRK